MPAEPGPAEVLPEGENVVGRARLREAFRSSFWLDGALAASAVAYIDAIEAKLGTTADLKVLKILLRGAIDVLAAALDQSPQHGVLARRERQASILDSVTGSLKELMPQVSHADRVRIEQYMEDVREIERRIQREVERRVAERRGA